MIALGQLLPIKPAIEPQIEAIALAAVAEGQSARMALVFCAKTRGAKLVRQRVKQGAVALILAVGVAACALPLPNRSKEAAALVDQANTISREKTEEACALYSKALELDPNNTDAYFGWGLALTAQDDWDGAITKFQRWTELKPDDPDAYFLWGIALAHKGDWDKAITKFQRVVELHPNYPDIYNEWGLALYRKGDLDGAITKYQQAIKIKPDNLSFCNWGRVLADKGDWDGAVAKFQRAIELDPLAPLPYLDWGLALYNKGDLDGAIAKYKQAIELSPLSASAYHNWGVALFAKGDLDGAIAKYKQVIKLNPDNDTSGNAYYNWGLALASKGDWDGAITKYQKSLSLPDNRDARIGVLASTHALAQGSLGQALEKKGQLKEAIAEYELALQINPNQVFAQNNLVAAKSKLAALENIDDSQQLPKDEPRLPLLRATVLAIAQFSQPEDTERGAAWVVKRQGSTLWLVTCAHLFRNERNEQSQAIQVQFYNPNPNLPAEKRASRAATVVQLAPSGGLDLAVLKVENAPADIRPLAMGPGSIPLLAPVYTIGHPDILAQAGPWQALSGEVAGRNGDRIGLNMTISQGNSGGPLLHKDTNQVIGIVLQSQGARNIGYAYDLNTVQTQLKQWGIL